MAGVLIDSSVLIAAERGTIDLWSHVAGREQDTAMISVVTVSELRFGSHRTTDPRLAEQGRQFADMVNERMIVVPVNLPMAEVHADLRAALQQRGLVIGPHDLWLAATCLAHDLSIATLNLGEFRRVPGLAVEDWSA